jgi:hypothetical protein
LDLDWSALAVALQCWVLECVALAFWMLAGGQMWRDRHAGQSDHVSVQVFDRRGGGLTGKGERMAPPERY